MPKYRKKPVEIEAIEFVDVTNGSTLPFRGRNIAPIMAFGADPKSKTPMEYDPTTDTIVIITLEGTMVAKPGDYIIRGVQGELYPCKPDIFKATYDKVEA